MFVLHFVPGEGGRGGWGVEGKYLLFFLYNSGTIPNLIGHYATLFDDYFTSILPCRETNNFLKLRFFSPGSFYN